MKKRLIALLMATTMVIGLTACGGGGGGTTADTSSDTTTEATDDASDKGQTILDCGILQDDTVFLWCKIPTIIQSSIFKNPKTVRVESTLSIKRHTPKRKAAIQGSTKEQKALDEFI